MSSIAFITLSRNREKVMALRDSIEAMLGPERSGEKGHLDWLLYSVDGEKYDLYSGYQLQGEAAEEDLLCFVHDDVRFLGNRLVWDRIVNTAMKPMTGWVGVAGTVSLDSDACWWTQKHTELRGAAYHPTQGEVGLHLNVWPHGAGGFGRVLVIDGVCMITSKRSFQRTGGFKDRDLKGFHFYDILASFRAHTEYGMQNWVLPLPLLHLSPGAPNQEWQENREIFMKRYREKLPARIKE